MQTDKQSKQKNHNERTYLLGGPSHLGVYTAISWL